MTDNALEYIVNGLEPIALIIRSDFDEPGVHFFTPANFSQQVAFMHHKEDSKIAPHSHNLVPRQVLFTQEALFVRKGKVKVNLFTSGHRYLQSTVLHSGDVILLCGGGHSFEMLEDSSMVEVKQGPYAGDEDKVRFTWDGSCK